MYDLPVEETVQWASQQAWAIEMAQCQQDSQWHAEGDVWTHTVGVYEALQTDSTWSQLGPGEQNSLLFAALLHDVAKPITTSLDPITGRVRSPKHAVKGESLARNILANLSCPFSQREMICALVRHHGAPVHLFTKPDSNLEATRLSWLVNNRLLYHLAIADFRGRDSRRGDRNQDDLDLFAELSSELGCFDSPYPFANDTARLLAGRRELSSLHYVPHEDFRCKVTVMSGLPGTGKDTWIAKHASGVPVVSLDRIRSSENIDPKKNQGRVVRAAREQCREYLRAETDFIINATNTMRQTRKQWIDLCLSYNAHVTIVYLEPSLETILDQNRSRERSVPISVIDRLRGKLQPPNQLEAHAVQWIAEEA